MSANTYLCLTDIPGTCLVIDPGLDQAAIQSALDEHGLTPTSIYCTHGHFDHLGSAEFFRRRYSAPVHLRSSDAKVARASNFMLMALKRPDRISVPEDFTSIDDDGTDDNGIDILGVPGHTAGSVVFRFDGIAFTGDTIYRDDVWRMAWPEEDGDRLVESIGRLWDELPGDTMVYPGHGPAAAFESIKQRNVPMRRLLGLDTVRAS